MSLRKPFGKSWTYWFLKLGKDLNNRPLTRRERKLARKWDNRRRWF